MIGIIKDENQTIESFLHFNELYSLLKCEKIYNDNLVNVKEKVFYILITLIN